MNSKEQNKQQLVSELKQHSTIIEHLILQVSYKHKAHKPEQNPIVVANPFSQEVASAILEHINPDNKPVFINNECIYIKDFTDKISWLTISPDKLSYQIKNDCTIEDIKNIESDFCQLIEKIEEFIYQTNEIECLFRIARRQQYDYYFDKDSKFNKDTLIHSFVLFKRFSDVAIIKTVALSDNFMARIQMAPVKKQDGTDGMRFDIDIYNDKITIKQASFDNIKSYFTQIDREFERNIFKLITE